MRLIDADKLLDTLGIDSLDCEKCSWSNFDYCKRGSGFADACSAIEDAPTVDAEPVRHGHWVDMGDFESCSVCNGTHLKEYQTYYGKCLWVKMDYCPHCGAKMDEKDD